MEKQYIYTANKSYRYFLEKNPHKPIKDIVNCHFCIIHRQMNLFFDK